MVRVSFKWRRHFAFPFKIFKIFCSDITWNSFAIGVNVQCTYILKYLIFIKIQYQKTIWYWTYSMSMFNYTKSRDPSHGSQGSQGYQGYEGISVMRIMKVMRVMRVMKVMGILIIVRFMRVLRVTTRVWPAASFWWSVGGDWAPSWANWLVEPLTHQSLSSGSLLLAHPHWSASNPQLANWAAK